MISFIRLPRGDHPRRTAVALLVVLCCSLNACAQTSSVEVRVLLLERVESCELTVPRAFHLTPVDRTSPLSRGRQLDEAVVAVQDKALRIDGTSFRQDRLRLRTGRRGTFELNGRPYGGDLVFLARDDGTLDVVNYVAMEEYLLGVLGPEIGSGAPLEAMKVQAVCARTYAWSRVRGERRTQKKGYFDLYCDTRSQVYRGRKQLNKEIERAVEATAGRILTYRGDPLTTYFHSTCGGHTASSAEVFGGDELQPLSGVPCDHCSDSKYYHWTLRLPVDELLSALRKADLDVEPTGLAVLETSRDGRVRELELRGGRRKETISGARLRKILGASKLRSARFDVRREGSDFVFEGGGWGHGVGMCQMGARALARKGYSAARILQYYYPGARLDRLQQ